jgi:hypothetical protein
LRPCWAVISRCEDFQFSEKSRWSVRGTPRLYKETQTGVGIGPAWYRIVSFVIAAGGVIESSLENRSSVLIFVCRTLCRNPAMRALAIEGNCVRREPTQLWSESEELLALLQIAPNVSQSLLVGSLNSGPGGRRFKSSLPDQSFQTPRA